MRKLFYLIIVISLILGSSLSAQISKGGRPLSFDIISKSTATSVPAVRTPQIDRDQLLLEDSLEQDKGIPFRFGVPFDVNYNLDNSGQWETLSDGSKIWRLQIDTENAYSINLIYDQFHLSPGVKLFIYNLDHTMLMII